MPLLLNKNKSYEIINPFKIQLNISYTKNLTS